MQTRVTNKLLEMDFDSIYEFISNSYWSKGIPKLVFAKALENSLCFGLMQGSEQLGFARMITDRASFAYLADVFIHDQYRGQGLSTVLLDAVFTHPDIQGLRRMILATRDAHGIYEKYGFEAIADPARLMHNHQPEIYLR